MFLRNYDNYWAATHLLGSAMGSGHAGYGNTSEFIDGYINQKTTSSAIETVCIASGGSYATCYLNPPFNFSISGICLGDGNTEPTYDDFQLSGNVVANKLVLQKTTNTYDETTKKYHRELLATYYNNTEDVITISEWGLFRGNPGSSSLTYSNNDSNIVLVFREVLSEPIVIEAGQTATIAFAIDIPTCSE